MAWTSEPGECPPVSAESPDMGLEETILAVGDVQRWKLAGHTGRPSAVLAFVAFHEVDAELLQTIRPSIVLSPLLSRQFDCIDLAQTLDTLGYRGKYRVIDENLPDPGVIAREVRALVPGLDFAIIRLDFGRN